MKIVRVDRRDFLKITSIATAGLILGVGDERASAAPTIEGKAAEFQFGPFIHVGTDGVVTIYVTRSEMGQGVRTAIPMLVCEEMDLDLDQVRVEQASFSKEYGHMATIESGSMRATWVPLRHAGAAARAMLVSVAASRWNVPDAECQVARGVITYGRKKLTFGEVAEAASKLKPPPDLKLKHPADYRIIGKSQNRIDDRPLVTGHAIYGSDIRIPGMLYAAIARAPLPWSHVATFDGTKAKAVPGVRDVVKVELRSNTLPWPGVAVVADSTWAALQGKQLVQATWQGGRGGSETTQSLVDTMDRLVSGTTGKTIVDKGKPDEAFAAAAKNVEARYEVPFLAHATMEPMTATAYATEAGVEIWAPTQDPDWIVRAVADLSNIHRDKVKVHVTMMGGGFGRRAVPDFAVEAALLSDQIQAPVQVVWTREDDMQHDYYRPPSVHRLQASLDASGKVTGWRHRLSSPSVNWWMGGDLPASETLGLDELQPGIPNFDLVYCYAHSQMTRGWWRSLANSTNGFVVASFLDEVAHALKRDPIDLRLALSPPYPEFHDDGRQRGETANAHAERVLAAKNRIDDVLRLRRTIELVREKSGWVTPAPAGVGRGFAAWRCFSTPVAQVVEVARDSKKGIRVQRVVAAIDCGLAVNPDNVVAQVEGAIVFALTAALKGKITFDGGRPQQSNFKDYELLRMDEMPRIEVHIVPSTDAPTGVGEPGLPPLAPALGNAIFALTGKRLRTLPFDLKNV